MQPSVIYTNKNKLYDKYNFKKGTYVLKQHRYVNERGNTKILKNTNESILYRCNCSPDTVDSVPVLEITDTDTRIPNFVR